MARETSYAPQIGDLILVFYRCTTQSEGTHHTMTQRTLVKGQVTNIQGDTLWLGPEMPIKFKRDNILSISLLEVPNLAAAAPQ